MRRGRKRGRRGKTQQSSTWTSNQNAYPVMAPSNKVLGGFPSEVRVRLKYVDVFALDPASGSVAAYQFDPRSCYDPNYTGTGHQPSNFDRWMQIYNAFTVVNTKFMMQNQYNSTSAVQPGTWGFLVSKSGSQVTGFSDPSTILEQPYVKYSTTPAGLLQNIPFPASVTAVLPSSGWLGVPTSVLKTAAFSGSAAAGPTETFYVEAFLISINGNDPGSCTFRVEMEFDVIFFMPKITVPS